MGCLTVKETCLSLTARIYAVFLIGRDIEHVRPAFDLVSNRRKLPSLLESFLGECRISVPTSIRDPVTEEMRDKFYLVEADINHYMNAYEVVCPLDFLGLIVVDSGQTGNSPQPLQHLVSRLMLWYKAWAPPPE